MGDRGTVKLDNGMYLYTHWGAEHLVADVRTALRKNWRWHEPDYLARIIFDTMIGNHHGKETGFGIMTEPMDEWRCVHVDCKEQRVTVYDHGRKTRSESFKRFVRQ